MNVPLAVSRTTYDDGLSRQGLKIWQNGELHTVKAPIKPYLISTRKLRLRGDFIEEQITVKPLNDFEERTAYRYLFPFVECINDLNALTKAEYRDRYNPELARALRENHMIFTERVAVDKPEFYTQYPDNLDSIFCFDIETLNKNFIDQNRIIAISQGNTRETWCHVDKEIDILENFRNDWRKADPDVVVGFNHKDFDFPYILRRMHHYEIPTDFFHRDGRSIDEATRVHQLTGRCMYDVYENVNDDQTIRTKNKRLKTVAKDHFQLDAIQEDLTGGTDYLLKDIPRLIAYCNSDVDTTLKIFDGYFAQSIAIANQVGFPLDNFNNPKAAKDGLDGFGRAKSGYWTMIGRIVAARGFGPLGFIENSTNRHKHPFLTSFQGAFSGSVKHGRFEDVLHVDVSGMYPSIQRSFNISPDTTRFYGFEPYDASVPILRERSNDHIIFCIPDENIKKNVLIKVSLKHTGVMPIFLTELLKERGKWKKLYNEAIEAEDEMGKKKYWSLQYAMKVLMNGTGYGVNTPPNVRYGDSSVGVLITGIGRWIIGKAIKFIEAKGFPCIEYDTDGTYHLYGKKTFPHDLITEINEYLEQLVTEVGPESKIEMEGTLWELMYAYKTKNYFLYSQGRWDDDGKFFFDKSVNLKGSAFKGSGKAPYMDKFISGMNQLIIDNATDREKVDFVRSAMNIKQYPIADLTKSVRPTMYPHQYKNNNLGKRLMNMAHKQLGIPPTPYMFYEYVKGIKGEMLSARVDPKQLDYEEYRKLVMKQCARYGLEDRVKKYVKDPGIREIKQMEYQ